MRRFVGTAVCAAVAAFCLPSALATSYPTQQPNPCTVSWALPTGDADIYMTTPNDPDLDITHASWQLTSANLVVTLKIAKLADSPQSGYGDDFEASFVDHDTQHTATFGYWRARNGGGPVFGDYAASGKEQQPTGLTPSYDEVHSQLTLTVPRSDLQRELKAPQRKIVATTLVVSSYAVTPAGDTFADYDKTPALGTILSFAACDAWLAKHGPKPAKPTPCQVDISDQTGDEDSHTPAPANTADDNLDIAHATFALTKSALVVTTRIARYLANPPDATGQDYNVSFGSHSNITEVGLDQDAVTGTGAVTEREGNTITVHATGNINPATDTVTITIPRSDIAAAYALKTTKALVLGQLQVSASWSYAGTAVGVADDADTDTLLNFASCDRYLGTHRS